MADAVIIGAGPNGLVAANLLADQGWEVTVLEEAPEPGGAVRSGELVEPGFTHDMFSAFYPFTLASPHMRKLDLERWGLEWAWSRIAVAHPTRDGTCPAISSDIEETVTSLDECAPGDGDAWRELYELWRRVRTRRARRLLRSVSPGAPGRSGCLRRSGRASCCGLLASRTLPVRRAGRGALPLRRRNATAGRQRAARGHQSRDGTGRGVRMGTLLAGPGPWFSGRP